MIQNPSHKIKIHINNLKKNHNLKDSIQQSFKSTIVKIIGMLAALLASILIGRNIGPEGLGIINIANKIVQIAILLGLMGVRQTIVREVSIAFSKKDWLTVKEIINSSIIYNGLTGIIIAFILIISSSYISNNIIKDNQFYYPIIILSIVIPAQIISRVYSASLNGFGKIWQSNLVDQTLSSVITLFSLFVLTTIGVDLNIITIAVIFSISRVLTTASVATIWRWSNNTRISEKAVICTKFIKKSIPLLFSESSTIIGPSLIYIIIGTFLTSKDAGLYAVSERIALLTGFFLTVVNSVISPKLANCYHNNKISEMKRLSKATSLILFILAIVTLILLILFGKTILSIWGNEFTNGYNLLIILTIGQTINVSTGSSGALLIMSGHTKTHSLISIFFLIFNIINSIIFAHLFGIIGVAVSMAISISAENITRLLFVHRKLGFWPIPFLKN